MRMMMMCAHSLDNNGSVSKYHVPASLQTKGFICKNNMRHFKSIKNKMKEKSRRHELIKIQFIFSHACFYPSSSSILFYVPKQTNELRMIICVYLLRLRFHKHCLTCSSNALCRRLRNKVTKQDETQLFFFTYSFEFISQMD